MINLLFTLLLSILVSNLNAGNIISYGSNSNDSTEAELNQALKENRATLVGQTTIFTKDHAAQATKKIQQHGYRDHMDLIFGKRKLAFSCENCNCGREDEDIKNIDINNEGQLIVNYSSGTTYLWDINPSSADYNQINTDNYSSTLVFNPKKASKFVIVTSDNIVEFWSTLNLSNPMKSFNCHNQAVSSVIYDAQGKFAYSGGHDGLVFKYDTNHLSGAQFLLETASKIMSMAISNDHLIIADSSKILKCFNKQTGELIKNLDLNILKGCYNPCVANLDAIKVISSPDGKYLFLASADGLAVIFNIQNALIDKNPEFLVLNAQPGYVSTAAFSPDSKNILISFKSANMQMPILWNIETRKAVELPVEEKLEIKDPVVNMLSYSSNEIYAVLNHGAIYKWQIVDRA